MQKIKLTLLFILLGFGVNQIVFAQYNIPEKPDFQTSVYDYIDLLQPAQKSNLEKKLIKYSDTTSTQIVVAIISTTKGENIGLLTPRWAHEWGVGQKKEDNGVFILLAKNDRKIWISPGYGVEHKLTAGITGELIRNVIIPEFKKGDYYSGLDKGSDAIFKVLNGEYQGARKSNQNDFPIGFFLIFLFIFVIILISISKNRRGGGKGGNRGNRTNGTSILDAIILSNMGRSSSRGSSGWGSSGGGWSSGGGGGFGGGFGGGGFSGGGAGGSW
ncbi:TPM domain-containing protein [Seonamhaeicola maritimus]|uniref:TPM domain-containing protein n=1 Tax=Seonamhaeicola maritimus TaxID=2591822 RepID=UPI0024943745|nr:TPM domain-containing protein [Seonamhaeicola maritimus]